ncbi:MAG: hypothetical protein JWP97_3811 [Labilithrix sp.]|nr:hypothetical protein [Labilithrix sp.]
MNNSTMARRAGQLAALERLIFASDTEVPPVLDDDDREAVHICLRLALESDAAFRLLLRRKGPLVPTRATDYLCNSLRSGIDFYAQVMSTTSILKGVAVPRSRGSIRQSMLAHGTYLRQLREPDLSLPRRMSLLMAAIRVQLLFFGHFWGLEVGFAPQPST